MLKWMRFWMNCWGYRLLPGLKTVRVTVLFQMVSCLSLMVAVSLSLTAK
ncbi:hypothetical protein BvCmsKKNP023_05015 [Escherichia coli]|nr:hypothetical protein BvCmsKKNP023_05015 [Escherichia coli]